MRNCLSEGQCSLPRKCGISSEYQEDKAEMNSRPDDYVIAEVGAIRVEDENGLIDIIF